MKKTILDFVDFEKINLLLEGFNKSTGFATAILDLEGNVLSKSGWRNICTDFHRVHPEASKSCIESDTRLASQMKAGEKFHWYKCLNGLIDVAVPIIINNEHVANLFTGQFFFEEPDRGFFIKQAEKYGFDTKKYLDALDQIPVVSEEKVKIVTDFLLSMTLHISYMTLQKIEQAKLIDALKESQEHLSIVFNNTRDLQLLAKYEGPKNFSVVEVNQSYIKTFKQYGLNLTADDLIGYSVAHVITEVLGLDENVMHYALSNYQQAIDSGERVKYDESIDVLGKPYHSKISLSPIQGTSDDQKYVVFISHDVTAEQEALLALQKSEENFRSLVDNTPDFIYSFDRQSRHTAVNKSVCDTLGLPEDQIVGKNHADLGFPEEVVKEWQELHQKVFTTKEKVETETSTEMPDGKVYTYWIDLVPVFDENGEVISIRGTSRDITDRKEAEKALRESEERYHLLFENSLNAVLLTAPDGKILHANPAACGMFGRSQEDIVAQGRTGIVDRTDPRLPAALEERKRTGKFEGELSFIRADGSKFEGEISTSVFRDKDGNERTSMIIRDITERKKAELALRDKDEKLSLALAAADEGLWEWNLSTDQIQFDAIALGMMGYGLNDLKGERKRGTWWMEQVHPDEQKEISTKFNRYLSGEADSFNVEFRIKTKRGSYIWVFSIGKIVSYNMAGKPEVVIGIYQNITQRKQDEMALASSEAKFRGLFQNTPDVVALIDVSGRIMDINKVTPGYTKDKVIGALFSDFLNEDQSQIFKETLDKTIQTGSTQICETAVLSPDGKEFYWLIKISSIKIKGLRTQLVVSCTDITERKLAEEKLLQSEERFRLAFENASIGVCLVDLNGQLIRVNEEMCKIFGYPKEEFEGMNVNDFTYSEDFNVSPDFIRRAKSGVVEQSQFEKRYINKNGELIWGQVSSSLVRDSRGEPHYFISHVQHITDKKKSEKELRDSGNRMLAVFNNTNDLQLLMEYHGQNKFSVAAANKSYVDTANLFGLNISENDLVGKTLEQLIVDVLGLDEDVFKYTVNNYQKVVDSTEQVHYDESIVVAGKPYHSEITLSPVLNSENECPFVLYNSHNITEKKIAEQALRESEQRLKLALDVTKLGTWEWDLRTNEVTVNERYAEMKGYTQEEIQPHLSDWDKFIHPDDRKKVQVAMYAHFKGETTTAETEFRFKHKSGDWVWIVDRGTVIERDENGEAVKAIGTHFDITELKKAEEALRRSNEQFDLAMNATKDGLYDWNLITNEIYYSPSWKKMLGYNDDELPNDFSVWEKLTEPEDVKKSWKIQNELITGKRDRFELEFKMKHKDGHWVEILSRAEAKFDESGKAVRIVGTHVDISERKKAETALRESEKNYKDLIDGMNETAWIIDFDGDLIDVNRTAIEMLGYTKEELLQIGLFGIDSRIKIEDIRQLAKTMPIDKFQKFESSHKAKDGTIFPVEVYSSLVTYNGQPAILSIARDITERKQAEEALRQSETRFRRIYEDIPISYQSLDANGLIIDVNPAWLAMFGYTSEEVLGRQMDEFFTPESKAGFAKRFKKFKKAGFTQDNEFQMYHKNGELLTLVFNGVFVYNSKGQPLYTHCVLNNITDRKLMETSLRDGEERYRILFETANDAIFILDGETFTACNEATICIFGCDDKSDIIGHLPWEFSPAKQPDGQDSGKKATAFIQAALNGVNQNFEWRHSKKDGTPFDAEISLNRIVSAGKTQLQAIVRDISERKRAELKLRESEERFKTLSNLTFEGIFIHKNGEIIDANESVSKIIGYPQNEIIGKNIFQLFIVPKYHALVREKLSKQVVSPYEVEIKKKNGAIIPVEIEARKILIKGEEFRVAAIRNISQRKQAEETLRASEEKFRLLAENSVDCIWTMDTKLRFTYLSPSLERMVDYKPEEWVGTHLSKHFRKKEFLRVGGLAAHAIKNYKTFTDMTFETKMLNRKKEEVDFEISSKLLFKAKGKLIGLQGTTRDITERKIAERKLDYRIRLEKLIADISTRFVGVESQNLDREIKKTLEQLGKFTKVDRICIFLFQGETGFADISYEWRARGIKSQMNELKSLYAADFPWLTEKLNRNEAVHIPRVADLPAEALPEKQLVQIQGNKSLLIIPLSYGRKLFGFIGFDSIGEERIWSEDDISLLRTIGEIFAHKLENRRFEQEREKLLHDMGERLKEMRLLFKISQFSAELEQSIDHFLMNTVQSMPQAWHYPEITCARIRLEDMEYLTKNFRVTRWCQQADIKSRGKKVGVVEVYYLKQMPELDEGPFLKEERELIETIANQIMSFAERKHSEDALKESEKRHKEFILNSPYGVFVSDKNGCYMQVNPAACKITGFSEEDLLSMSISDLLSEDWKDKGLQHFQTVVRDGKAYGEIVFRHKSGKRRWWAVSAVRLSDTRFLAFCEDITERKQNEDALRESEFRFKELFENMSSGVAVYEAVDDGQDFVFKDFNRAGERIDNIHRDKLLGKSVLDVFPGAQKIGLFDVFQRVWKTGQPEQFPESFYQDGRIVGWRENFIYKLPDGEIVAVYDDITSRKQAEIAQRVSEAKYRGTIENFPMGILLLDSNGIVTTVNPAITKITELPADEVVGKTIRQSMPFIEDAELLQCLSDLIEKKSAFDVESEAIKLLSGKVIYMRCRGMQIKDIEENSELFLVVFGDITDRVLSVKEKEKLETQVRRSQKMETIGTLAGGIAHDFNNILTPIMGYTDLAISSLPAKNPLREDLTQVLKGAQRAKELVQQILTFSRQIEQERKPLHLHLIVKEAVQLLRPTIPSTIDIRQRIDSTSAPVMADATQIHQVIINLCTNAYQAMEEKGGTLTIELKQVHVDEETVKNYPALKPKDYVLLTITDTGIGMDRATIERIFDPFFSTKSVDKGTGLGLSVVHGIVRSHYGDVLVYSEPGKGTKFHVYLPVVEQEKPVPSLAVNEQVKGGNETIMVVDDEQMVANVVKKLLEQFGYKIQVFNSSKEALTAFFNNPDEYDLLISDLTMPGMTGLEMAKKMHVIRPELPFVLITGYGEDVSKDVMKLFKIESVIGKPINMKLLATAIRMAIEK